MAMNDEETVALIAGGHTFGKTHGAAPRLPPRPRPGGRAAGDCRAWAGTTQYGTGKGDDTITSGLEVTWTYHPTRWDNEFFHILFSYEWELFKSPAGAHQWRPKNGAGDDLVPMAPRPVEAARAADAHHRPGAAPRPGVREDLAAVLREPRRVRRRVRPGLVQADPPRHGAGRAAYLGPEVPAEELLWQDPLPKVDHELIDDADATALKEQILASGLTTSQLVSTTWAAASSFRGSDKRGGVNGARIRLAPQKDWEVNNPVQLAAVLETLEGIQASFNDGQTGGKQVSLADLIVLAGNAAVEQAAQAAGVEVTVPFHPGRTDATQEQTDVESFGYLEPVADGFRSYYGKYAQLPAEYLLVDKANLLTLSAPEMTVLVGGLRVLGANWDGTSTGVLTDRPGVLTNDFFVNLLELGTTWKPLDPGSHAFEGRDDATGEVKWVGSRADLVFGSNSELRALAEVYASDDAKEKFVRDFVQAWGKVTELDRFDLR